MMVSLGCNGGRGGSDGKTRGNIYNSGDVNSVFMVILVNRSGNS